MNGKVLHAFELRLLKAVARVGVNTINHKNFRLDLPTLKVVYKLIIKQDLVGFVDLLEFLGSPMCII